MTPVDLYNSYALKKNTEDAFVIMDYEKQYVKPYVTYVKKILTYILCICIVFEFS